MRTHEPRPPRRALPLLLLAALLALGGGASWAGLAPRPAAAVTPGKNGRIAAELYEGGEQHIVTMTGKGKQVQPVTDGTNDHGPRWSPDGTTLLFNRKGNRRQDIWTVPAAGGDPVNLTNNRLLDAWGAAWSPDGTRIAYVLDKGVWTMNADGTDPRVLLLYPGGGASILIDWSPDGQRLAFEARSGGTVQVWTVYATGQNLNKLTSGADSSEAPRWSPDGTRIAFARGGDVWTMQADGTDQRNMTNTPDVDESGPAWSPNGKRVLFAVVDPNRCHGLAKIPANGGKAKAVPKTAGTCYFHPDQQTKPKKGKGKSRPAAAAKADRAAKPAGHRKAAR